MGKRGVRKMSKMKEVASLLGGELGEEFNIKDDCFSPYKLTNDGLIDCCGDYRTSMLGYLLVGNREIEKIPFKPKYNEWYWYYSWYGKQARKTTWLMYDYNLICHKIGNCFRTKEEAEKETVKPTKVEVKEEDLEGKHVVDDIMSMFRGHEEK